MGKEMQIFSKHMVSLPVFVGIWASKILRCQSFCSFVCHFVIVFIVLICSAFIHLFVILHLSVSGQSLCSCLPLCITFFYSNHMLLSTKVGVLHIVNTMGTTSGTGTAYPLV